MGAAYFGGLGRTAWAAPTARGALGTWPLEHVDGLKERWLLGAEGRGARARVVLLLDNVVCMGMN